ncbi:hypothetical protein E1263_14765 [Kribbella antibiotica]|uniref:Uncharacterized protein n=1 Tax=Kribbella antibiotica TaxID=190195 RepID=A0A4R4ZMU4_9ACTN|nr:hypothetical protein [Kribbella antibiotica]TDD59446.1 hypothetical protein E1263_14765 [Kribbella antibiotica]
MFYEPIWTAKIGWVVASVLHFGLLLFSFFATTIPTVFRLYTVIDLGAIVVWILLATGGRQLSWRYASRSGGWAARLWLLIPACGIAKVVAGAESFTRLEVVLRFAVFLGAIAILYLTASAMRRQLPRVGDRARDAGTISLVGLGAYVLALNGVGNDALSYAIASEPLYLWTFFAALLIPPHEPRP